MVVRHIGEGSRRKNRSKLTRNQLFLSVREMSHQKKASYQIAVMPASVSVGEWGGGGEEGVRV